MVISYKMKHNVNPVGEFQRKKILNCLFNCCNLLANVFIMITPTVGKYMSVQALECSLYQFSDLASIHRQHRSKLLDYYVCYHRGALNNIPGKPSLATKYCDTECTVLWWMGAKWNINALTYLCVTPFSELWKLC